MKTVFLFSCVLALVVGLNACNKTAVDPDVDGAARSASVSGDSTKKPHSLTVVDVASLPTNVTTYITTNYAGATIKEARKDKAGNFVVAITVSDSTKVLFFKADGTFVAEAGRKPGHARGDSTGKRKHTPGDSTHRPKPARGDSTHHNRPGQGQGPISTTVAVSGLPAAITTYINTNYAGATINKAVQEKKDSDYLVLITTADNKRAILEFASDGTFKRARTSK
ncbi:PepSY-like domain-containing protein [Spirosoma sp. BT702]|uniref:PepSY-like domain-containing protein n=1 Tax=Spirosoma profusum TaxID=2771354 RepID=A0A926XZU5_9BACT|nr:PepSY-like domain-containing protein [Spirosoma profusum]MBD2703989.1 PepSY-like domain-containing protein [Spirosoma profusum]